MKGRSLRVRLLVSHILAIVVILGLTGVGLVVLFERHVERRVGTELDTYLNQIAAKLTFDETGTPLLGATLADPRFENVFGGLYWQVTNENSGKLVRSRSLWDTHIKLPADTPPVGVIHVHDAAGPENSTLLVHERRLIFAPDENTQTARIVTALDRTELRTLTSAFAWEVALALSVLGVLLIVSAWVQVIVGLRPLTVIRTAVAAIREGNATSINTDLPTEITPLVDELNGLLTAQESMLKKARMRAADLAHGFKTPLTALKTDVGRLRARGEKDIAADIEMTSLLMQRQIEHELAKARVRDTKSTAAVDIPQIVQGLIRTLERTPQAKTKTFKVELQPNVAPRMDGDDLSDVLGNLLENAVNFAERTVVIQTRRAGPVIRFDVEDDGPGVDDDLRQSITERGTRLDQSRTGSGLGLAIVKDILEIYGVELTLARSGLGGLKASFDMPLAE